MRSNVAAFKDDASQFVFPFQPQGPKTQADVAFERLEMREERERESIRFRFRFFQARRLQNAQTFQLSARHQVHQVDILTRIENHVF